MIINSTSWKTYASNPNICTKFNLKIDSKRKWFKSKKTREWKWVLNINCTVKPQQSSTTNPKIEFSLQITRRNINFQRKWNMSFELYKSLLHNSISNWLKYLAHAFVILWYKSHVMNVKRLMKLTGSYAPLYWNIMFNWTRNKRLCMVWLPLSYLMWPMAIHNRDYDTVTWNRL